MSAAVEIRDLAFAFGNGDARRPVLSDVRLRLEEGEIVILTGPSGSGKTTLLTLIGALRSVQQGSVRVLGREIAGLSPGELVRVRREIGFIFQAHNLFDSLTAIQNVYMALDLTDWPARERRERAERMLARIGLAERARYKPQALSGGQRQRVAIARALVHSPKLVLADEPTAALDADSGAHVIDLFREMARERRATILIVTHDSRILSAADRIVNLVDGRVVSDIDVAMSIEICDFLKRATIFAHHTPSTLTEIAQNVRVEAHGAGTTLFREGDAGDRFYIVRRGRVEVLRESPEGPQRLADLGRGEFFGEAALITDDPRNATVRTIDDVELFVLDKSQFQAALGASKSFREELLEIFKDRR